MFWRGRLKTDPARRAPAWLWVRRRRAAYLKVVYVPDPEPGSVFVITAYDLGPKVLKALRRRRKKS
jgi:hypothetical protein